MYFHQSGSCSDGFVVRNKRINPGSAVQGFEVRCISNESHFYFCLSVVFKAVVLLSYWVTVKAATLILISRRGLTILSAREGIFGYIYNLIKI